MRLSERPVLAAVLGATIIAGSGTLTRLSEETPATVAVWRCLWAIPFLWVLSHREDAKFGKRSSHERLLASLAGVAFTFDLILWHWSIREIGAGMATVLGNLSSVVVALLAWLLFREKPGKRLIAILPIVLLGVVLATGTFGGKAYGSNPSLGVVFGLACSVVYALFIVIYREGSKDLRRLAGPLLDATAVGGFFALVVGPFVGGVHLAPSWNSQFWLIVLAISSQVLGWLVISVALPRLPASLTALILLIQPVGGIAISAVVLGERPSLVQLLGALVIVAGVAYAVRGSRTKVDVPEVV
ncbi:EamA-like transporter family protein [mine drainage metagenome]|uniref:EamA-like transporter family protein n=1 Tax=mine drainage metagenome TaxID=410659 RepID=A0A1J5Q1L1_9ZZZZ